jgi:NAD+ kinase
MGSLGFLTPFDFKFHEKILNEVISGNVAVLLRTRLKCSIVKDAINRECSQASSRSLSSDELYNDEKKSSLPIDEKISHLALNEVIIDRGPNSYLSNLDLYINDRFITKVQGDGKHRR